MKPNPSHRRFQSSPARAAGFSLVEMLAVITIVLFLMSLTVLSVRGLGGGASRKTAVATLMSVFDQARMMAISDGRPTYVVFVSAPKDSTNLTTSTLPDSMWGRAYALFEDPVIADNTTSFSPVQRSNWLYLPTGIAFKADHSSDPTHSSLTDTSRGTANYDPNDQTKFNVASRTSSAAVPLSLPYVKFDGMGQIVDHNGDIVDAATPCLRVLVFEGFASWQSVETFTNRAAINATTNTRNALDEIILKPTTGRAAYTVDPVNNLAAASVKTP